MLQREQNPFNFKIRLDKCENRNNSYHILTFFNRVNSRQSQVQDKTRYLFNRVNSRQSQI